MQYKRMVMTGKRLNFCTFFRKEFLNEKRREREQRKNLILRVRFISLSFFSEVFLSQRKRVKYKQREREENNEGKKKKIRKRKIVQK